MFTEFNQSYFVIRNTNDAFFFFFFFFYKGTCFFTPIIGGWLGDITAGRYNTIYGSLLAYIVGTVTLTVITYKKPSRHHVLIQGLYGKLLLVVSLVVIAFAVGGVKANLSLMGADQVKRKGQRMVQRFFVWFYWFIQVGSLLAFTVVVYVQQNVNYFYGYLITVVSITCGTMVVVIGRNRYLVYPPRKSALMDARHILAVGIKNKLFCKRNPHWTHWLDGAKDTMGGTFSEEMVEVVKSIVHLCPILLTFIFYWTIYGQVRENGHESRIRLVLLNWNPS